MRLFTNTLIILLLCANCSAFGDLPIEDIHTIPFEKTHGLMLINAVVDGVEGKLIFDTGSDAIVLNGTDDMSQSTFETVSGEVKATDVQIKLLQLGSYTLSNIDGYKTDLSHLLEQYDGSILGIFGANALASEIIHIDNVKNVIELYPNRYINTVAEGQYRKTTLVSVTGLPAIELEIEGSTYIFLLDTGCTISIIDKKIRKKHATYFVESDSAVSISSARKSSKCSTRYLAESLSLGNVNLKGLAFASRNLSKLSGQKLGGILSIDQLPFDEILIDWNNKQIYFKI